LPLPAVKSVPADPPSRQTLVLRVSFFSVYSSA
jgi:hypothetical protein